SLFPVQATFSRKSTIFLFHTSTALPGSFDNRKWFCFRFRSNSQPITWFSDWLFWRRGYRGYVLLSYDYCNYDGELVYTLLALRTNKGMRWIRFAPIVRTEARM
ncbi:unnamed protein product, partial [Sphacelaria rigidula]